MKKLIGLIVLLAVITFFVVDEVKFHQRQKAREARYEKMRQEEDVRNARLDSLAVRYMTLTRVMIEQHPEEYVYIDPTISHWYYSRGLNVE